MNDAKQAPPGWYQDSSNAAQMRWWDGQRWTEFVAPAQTPLTQPVATPAQPVAAPTQPVATPAQPVAAPMPAQPTSTPARLPRVSSFAAIDWRRIPLSTWVVAAFVTLFLVLSIVGSGFGGLLVGLGFVALLTGAYTAVTRRRSWALLPSSRKVGTAVVATGLVVMMIGGATSGSTRERTTPVEAATKISSATPTASGTPTPTATPNLFAELTDPVAVKTPADGPSVVIADNTVTAHSANDLLATLPVKGKAAKTGYSRTSQFGEAWLDVDHNGCDTRNDVLARDLTASTKSGACTVTA